MIFELQTMKANLHLEACYRRGTNVETDVLAEMFPCKIPLQPFGPTAFIFMRWTLFQVAALHVLECNQQIDTVSGIHSNVVLFYHHIALVGGSRFLC